METPLAPPSSRRPLPQARPWPLWLRIVLPLLILGLGGGAAALLVVTRPEPEKKDEAKATLPVEVVPITVGEHAVTVRAQGMVRAARQVVLTPEITGRVVWLSPELVPGGRVRTGQPLVRINARDYQLAVRQQQAQVASQQLALKVEGARKSVAAREWELYQAEQAERRRGRKPKQSKRKSKAAEPQDAGAAGPIDPLADAGPLALRGPQVRSAEIGLESARSSLAQAQLKLGRTGLVAPFNAFVQTEGVELGQLIGPTSQLATLVGTDAYWVQVSMPVDQLGYIALPNGNRPGARAKVWVDLGAERVEREGQIVRLLGDLDPVGRMARVLVEIPDPLQLDKDGAGAPGAPKAAVEGAGDDHGNGGAHLPLLIGAFVHVEIEGKSLEGVAEIPARALQPNDRVYVLGEGDKLEIRPVEVLLRAALTTVVRGELATGDRLVISTIDAPVEGTLLRVLAPSGGAPAGSGSAAATAPASSASAGARP